MNRSRGKRGERVECFSTFCFVGLMLILSVVVLLCISGGMIAANSSFVTGVAFGDVFGVVYIYVAIRRLFAAAKAEIAAEIEAEEREKASAPEAEQKDGEPAGSAPAEETEQEDQDE